MLRVRPIRFAQLAPPLLLAMVAAGCGVQAAPNADILRIGAYSVVREAFHEGLLPAFAAKWKAQTGREIAFEESYSASGAQARSIASGFDADLAILSHSGDMQLLVKAGKVRPDWNAGPDRGILTHSLVVIGHRPGNPKSIHDWADLAKPGVGVLYPDPKTSGGARWNVNAIYGAAWLAAREKNPENPDLEPVRELLAGVQANVVNMDHSGRRSMANFSEQGTGDVVVTYENELRLRAKEGDPIPYVVPRATLLIESPAAIVEKSVARHGNRAVVEAFLDFMRSPEGQAILVDYGFRPMNLEAASAAATADWPQPETVFTVADLGGWDALKDELYAADGLWTNIAADVARNRGK